MKQLKIVLPLFLVLVAAATFRGFGVSQSPPPWKDAGALNIAGVQLGMTRTQVQQTCRVNDFGDAGVNVVYSYDHKVSFVSGLALRENDSTLCSFRDGYKMILNRMGSAYHHARIEKTDYSFYRAGSHWVIMRYTEPELYSRASSVPEFGIATDASAIAAEWGHDLLAAKLAAR